MANPARPTTPRRRGRPLVAGVVGVVLVGGLGLAWAANQPSTFRMCTLGLAVDPVGASTAQGARVRFAEGADLDVAVNEPDELTESADRSTAIYFLDGPERGPVDPSRTYYRQLVVERGDDGVWRVVDANRCERGTD